MNHRHLAKRSLVSLFVLVVGVPGLAGAQDVPPAVDPESPQGGSKKVEVHFGEIYAERDNQPLRADIYLPAGAGPFPAVLVVHGGAWRSGSRAQLGGLAERLAQAGYTAVAISYRLAPEHKFPTQLDDCRDAVRWMRSEAAKWKIDPARIGGLGYSAGGHLVALLGALNGSELQTVQPDDADDSVAGTDKPDPTAKLQVVIAGGAPCEFRTIPAESGWLAFWLGGTRAEEPDAYRLASPAAFATSDDPPMYFYHGETDRLVALQSPQEMCKQLDEAGVENELYVVAHAGHGGAAGDREALRRGLAFLDKHLKNLPVGSAADANPPESSAGAAP